MPDCRPFRTKTAKFTTDPSYTDRNGNQITVDATGNFTDTLGGAAALSITGAGTPSSPMTFTYKAPGTGGTGVNVAVTINYKSYTVATNFGTSGIHEYGATAVSLVDNITLPDNSKYTFAYEATPSTPSAGACTPLAGTDQTTCVTARLASVKLPTDGTISYFYYNSNNNFPACTTGNNGVFSDGSASCLKRTTPDGTWTYTRALGTGAASTTTVSDPSTAANQTVIQFQGIYETQRQTYQGSTSGALLQTINTCYNGAASPCTGTAIALITRRTQLVAYPDNTGQVCKHDQFFDTYGLPTEQDDYDYGTGAPASTPLRKVITVFNRNLTNGIVSMPSSITVCNGAGTSTACTGPSGSSTGTVVGQTTFAYDETAVVAPTGTSPQHISITGSRGNPTTIKRLVQGTTFLTNTATYYDTGNPQSFTDVNGPASTVTFNYPDATSTCGNAFPASVTEPLNLSGSMTWNCLGGVQLTAVDENGKTTTTAYTDPYFWRHASVTDPASAIANFSYPTTSPYNWSESMMTVISGSSVVDGIITGDGLGRAHLKQKKQGPTSMSYDTVETDYDSLGRVSRATVPYGGTYGQTSTSAPATTITYDALSRPLIVTDPGNGTASYTYMQNDAYISVGPPPTGEIAKRRQLEYNALGQLTSVCEVTSASQSGSCGQTSSATGYLALYTHDALGNLTGVTQNAQPNGTAQTRSYSFDGLSRLTSETNAESGTTSYTYDSAAGCTGSYNGDLVKRVDAIGNTACYTYDALHRNLSVTYPSGSYATLTPSKYFVYDSATVNGASMANAKSRMAEAYTCFSPCSSKTTDTGFSYTFRGEVSDVYEMTPHSSPSYYHVSQTYWPHRAPYQLSTGITGLPTISYGGTIGSTVGLDGEGRITQVTAASGQNPVTSVTYNNSGLPSQVTFGSADTDIFAYDPNTMRMTQYQFNINGQSSTGALTWNANSTLQKLVVTDAFNGADNQTCNYAHDDLSRISSANCGSAASQTFSYDPFGNITKSGSPNGFLPTYNSATNRFSSIPGASVSYDANGNVLTDGSHTYTWDADGKSLSLDGVGLTFDALDRMVEQNRSGTYTEIVYSPGGAKLALMSGTTLTKGFVPLPGQATAVYTSGGLDHYRHSDWLGSVRLTSSPTRTVLSTAAYAPFGETYAQSGTSDLSFTGQNQDTVSGDYDFLFREYSTQGRWPSPDPAGLSAVNPTDPQSWNRYAYVRGNPLALIDPLGLTSGNDCNRGPCTPFSYMANGCTYNVTYSPQTGSDGFMYDMPSTSLGNCGGHTLRWWSCSGFLSYSCGTSWLQTKAFFQALARPISTGPGSCIQVALDAVREPLHAVHEVVHPLQEENLAPLAAMVQSPMPVTTTGIAAELWSMTTGAAVATGRGPVADDFRDIVRQGSLILVGATAAIVPKVEAAVAAVEKYLPTATLFAADVIGLRAVIKEGVAAANGNCKP